MAQRPHDWLGKQVIAEATERYCRVETELEVAPEPQAIDIWLEPVAEPGPGMPPHLALLLGRMCRQPAALELFSQAPSLSALLECLRKQLGLAHVHSLPAKGHLVSALSPFWIVCAGRPTAALRTVGASALGDDWPQGFYSFMPGIPGGIVVISELPRSRDTLLLRLLGRRRVLRDALAELRTEPDLWPILKPVLARWSFQLGVLAHRTPEEEALLMQTHDLFEEALSQAELRGHTRGQLNGERSVIRRQLEAKFGELPGPVLRKLEAADERECERLAIAFVTARTLEDIFD